MEKRVTHLIVGLGKGGAETMLYQVLKCKTDPDIQYKVISLGASHYYEEPIRNLGIPMIEVALQKKPLSSLIKVFREMKGSDTLCCWMDHANLIGAILGRFSGVPRIVWNIRHSNTDPKYEKKLSLLITRYCAKISKKVDVIAYNGKKAKAAYEGIGFCREKAVVLDNGVDCETFCPDGAAKDSVRKELHIPENKKLILSVARDHPIKDIPTFVKAFSVLHQRNSDSVAIMCGNGITTDNKQIAALCSENGLLIGQDIFLLGMRNDIPRMMAACDLYVLHSAGEAFPNTLIQAMACGCVCVSTDVGDARRILQSDAWIVYPCEPFALFEKMDSALNMKPSECTAISETNRDRMMNLFGINKVISKYEELF